MTESNVHTLRVFQGHDGQWYYETVAANNQVLNTSEGYTRKNDAVRAGTKAAPDFKKIHIDEVHRGPSEAV